MKVLLGKLISGLIVSPHLRSLQRTKAALQRRLRGATAQVHYCYQVDDHYSQLMLQILPALAANQKLELVLHIVPPPDSAAAPNSDRPQAWPRRGAGARKTAKTTGLADVLVKAALADESWRAVAQAITKANEQAERPQ